MSAHAEAVEGGARPAKSSKRADPGLSASLFSDERIRFVLTGSINAAFALGCFAVYQYVVGRRFGYMWTLLPVHITTVLFAFMTHRRLVFRVSGSIFRDLWKFESVYLVALAINAVLLPFAVEILGLPVLLAQSAVMGVNALVSWLGHSRFTFKRRRAPV